MEQLTKKQLIQNCEYLERRNRELKAYAKVYNQMCYTQSENSKIERHLHEGRKQKTYEEKNHWPFIQYERPERLISALIEIEQQHNPNSPVYMPYMNGIKQLKFLDVGCGIGNIVILAQQCGVDDHVIEFDGKLIERANLIFGSRLKDKITHGDALEFENYEDYDIIFYYCPLKNPELQKKLELYIECHMKVGAILIPVMKNDYKNVSDKEKFEQIEFNPGFNGMFGYKKIAEIS